MRQTSQTCGSATEAAGTPTDWATLGARILEAARQAAVIHMTKVGEDRWSMVSGLDVVMDGLNSAEPNE